MKERKILRIISGLAKGKRLKAPAGLNTRPITDMIKEALFNVLGNRVMESKFLDLFAGSGSVGIEALSRGAKKVVFVDSSGEAIKVIKENLANCGLESDYEVYRSDVFKALGLLHRQVSRFELIYIDPPFTNERIFNEVMGALGNVDILESDGIVVIRTPRKKDILPTFNQLQRDRVSNYGESNLNYYSIHEEDTKHDGDFSHIR
ncbi:MAG: 16S rRNA (guanine(966)-N(2))-methyltransferase RsmD [Firmicutes bacterium HGW-Firmicutes-15]|nr:MAG: 16S rRNA (guanine(966)-N(2))-methyltransferase RsmD [Firmicutes bacterium HGW-Firmicutes-15]